MAAPLPTINETGHSYEMLNAVGTVNDPQDAETACKDVMLATANAGNHEGELLEISNSPTKHSATLDFLDPNRPRRSSGLPETPRRTSAFRMDSDGDDDVTLLNAPNGNSISLGLSQLHYPELHTNWFTSKRSIASNMSYCSRLNTDASFQAISAQPMMPVLLSPLVRSTFGVNDLGQRRSSIYSGITLKPADRPVSPDLQPVPMPKADSILQFINTRNLAQTLVMILCFVSYTLLAVNGYAEAFFMVGTMNYTCADSSANAGANFFLNSTEKLHARDSSDQCFTTSDSGLQQPCTSWNYSSTYYAWTMLADFDLVCARAYGVSLFQSISYLGATVGVFIFGPLADSFGRRTVMLVATPACLCAATLLVLTPTYGFMMLLFRFLVGLLTDAVYTTNFTLVMEIASERKRFVFGPLMRTGWPLAAVVASYLGWLLQRETWRSLQWACCIVSFAALPMVLLIPESPLWLCAKAHDDAASGREKKAAKKLERAAYVMKRMARLNNVPVDEQQWNMMLKPTARPLVGVFSDPDLLPHSPLRRRRSSQLSYACASLPNNNSMLLMSASKVITSPNGIATTPTPTTTLPSNNKRVEFIPPSPSFFSAPLFRPTILLIVIQSAMSAAWSGNAFYATGFFPGSPYATLTFLSVAQIIANYSLVYMIEWCGSTRRTMMLLQAVCVVIFGMLTCLVGSDEWLEQTYKMPREIINYVYVMLAVLICCGTGAATSTAFVYSGEIYPVRVRQTGLGICGGIGSIFGGLAPFATNLLGVVWRPFPALLFWLCCVFGFLAAVGLPAVTDVTGFYNPSSNNGGGGETATIHNSPTRTQNKTRNGDV